MRWFCRYIALFIQLIANDNRDFIFYLSYKIFQFILKRICQYSATVAMSQKDPYLGTDIRLLEIDTSGWTSNSLLFLNELNALTISEKKTKSCTEKFQLRDKCAESYVQKHEISAWIQSYAHTITYEIVLKAVYLSFLCFSKWWNFKDVTFKLYRLFLSLHTSVVTTLSLSSDVRLVSLWYADFW